MSAKVKVSLFGFDLEAEPQALADGLEAVIGALGKLFVRSQQSGEWTPEQRAAYDARLGALMALSQGPPPPPPEAGP